MYVCVLCILSKKDTSIYEISSFLYFCIFIINKINTFIWFIQFIYLCDHLLGSLKLF